MPNRPFDPANPFNFPVAAPMPDKVRMEGTTTVVILWSDGTETRQWYDTAAEAAVAFMRGGRPA